MTIQLTRYESAASVELAACEINVEQPIDVCVCWHFGRYLKIVVNKLSTPPLSLCLYHPHLVLLPAARAVL